MDGAKPFYIASRNFSIKYYYEKFNPNSIDEVVMSLGKFMYEDNSKYGSDAIHRIQLFASDNNKEYKEYRAGIARNKTKGINLAEAPVYHSSKQFGYYDCLTALEAEMQILKNDYTIKAAKGGNIMSTIKKWQGNGLVGQALSFSVKNFNKNIGEIVTQNDFAISGVAETMQSIADKTKKWNYLFCNCSRW